MTPAPPRQIGRYEVLGEVGAGGMGEILLARLVGVAGFERPVVLKRILPRWASEPGFVEMFLDEARIVACIRHSNVVHVEDLGHEGQDLFIVMEYLEGESVAGLAKRLTLKGMSLDPALAAHIMAEACSGLHAAHELVDDDGKARGLVHRDISPQNLFVTYQGAIKVLDFGIARTEDRKSTTETGQLKGKQEYMSPEQCRAETLDRRSDIFALGIVLHELLTGHRLFKRFNSFDTMLAITTEPIVAPSRIRSGVPQVLERVCMRALARNVDERYPTAQAMRSDLIQAMRELAGDDPEASLASLMRTLFSDRIEEKRELLRKMRDGSEVPRVPAGEVDVDVELPSVAITLARAETAAATPAAWARRRGRRLIAPGLVLLAAAGLFATHRSWMPLITRPASTRAPDVARETLPAPAAPDLGAASAEPSVAPPPARPPSASAPLVVASASARPVAAPNGRPKSGRGPHAGAAPASATSTASVVTAPPPPPEPTSAEPDFHRFK